MVGIGHVNRVVIFLMEIPIMLVLRYMCSVKFWLAGYYSVQILLANWLTLKNNEATFYIIMPYWSLCQVFFLKICQNFITDYISIHHWFEIIRLEVKQAELLIIVISQPVNYCNVRSVQPKSIIYSWLYYILVYYTLWCSFSTVSAAIFWKHCAVLRPTKLYTEL